MFNCRTDFPIDPPPVEPTASLSVPIQTPLIALEPMTPGHWSHLGCLVRATSAGRRPLAKIGPPRLKAETEMRIMVRRLDRRIRAAIKRALAFEILDSRC